MLLATTTILEDEAWLDRLVPAEVRDVVEDPMLELTGVV